MDLADADHKRHASSRGGYPDRILTDHAVYISGDRIREIGPTARLEELYPKAREAGCRRPARDAGQHLRPYPFLRRLLPRDGHPRRCSPGFSEILEKLWWPLDKSLLEEDIRYSALVCLVDAISHGTTTLVDHHALHPMPLTARLTSLQMPLTNPACGPFSATRSPTATGSTRPMRASRKTFASSRGSKQDPRPRLAGTFGLHASLTLSGATLQACSAAIPDGTGFHIHVAEHEADEYDSLAKSNMRVVDRLKNHGILGPKTIAAHCVHIDAREIELLKETGTWVTHQPRSNMNNGGGARRQWNRCCAPACKVCLGNDGFSNAMWEEWKAAYFLHKVTSRDPRRMPGVQVVQMAVENNAALANVFFPDAPIGQVTPTPSRI